MHLLLLLQYTNASHTTTMMPLLRGLLLAAVAVSLPSGTASPPPPPPPPTRFVCRASVCVESDDGLPLAECAKFCLGPAPPPPPTCADGPADGRSASLTLQLACPAAGVITAVTFAQYGLISGTCPAFTSTGCAADISKPVEAACIGQSSCTVNCDHSCCPSHPWCCGCTFTSGSNKTRQYVNVSDPLPGASKSQAVQVSCNNSLPNHDQQQAVATSPTSPPSSGTAENNVAYFSWYSYTGCDQGRLGEPGCLRNLSASPSAAHRNLATDGDLVFLQRSHNQFSIPGMLLLQNSKWRAGVFGENLTGLQPGWEAAVDDCIATLVPLAKGNGGYIHGVQLGDEMVCGSVKNFSFENLSALAARMHDALHPHGVFIFTNECAGTPGQWPEIPAGLDVVSLDAYGEGASEAVAAKQFYERFISKLKPHQSVWLVPGLFGFNATGPNPTDSHLRECWGTVMAEADEVLVEKMSAYWAWADADPRITGVIPWHWANLGADFKPAKMQLGCVYRESGRFLRLFISKRRLFYQDSARDKHKHKMLRAVFSRGDSYPKTLAWIAAKVALLAPHAGGGGELK